MNKTLVQLQEKAEALTSSRSAESLLFSDELANVSVNTELSERDLQEAAFRYGAEDESTKSRVQAKALLRSGLNKKGASAPIKQTLADAAKPGSGAEQISLKQRNRRLEQQVAVLNEAFKNTEEKSKKTKDGGFKASQRLISQTDNSRREAAEVTRRVREIKSRIATGSQGELVGKELDKELDRITSWAAQNKNTYGQVAVDLDENLSGLLDEVKEAQEALVGQRGALEESGQVYFDVSDILENPNDQKRLEAFLDRNLGINNVGDSLDVVIENGQLAVSNDADNAQRLHDSLSNFRINAGNVVSVSGQELINPSIESNPVIASAFTGTTADGRSFAILDEAQLQTIMQAAQVGSGQASSVVDQRDVIVGAKNDVVNESVSISESGADFNGLMVAGASVNLAHNQLMCINNGDTLTVIRAGEVRDWGMAPVVDRAVAAAVEHTDFQVPEIGQLLRFEKTLLAAGESPDIVLNVASIRRIK